MPGDAFDLTCVILPKGLPRPEKMDAKNSHQFWRFSTFDLEYVLTKLNLLRHTEETLCTF